MADLPRRLVIWPLSSAKRTSAGDCRTIAIYEYTPWQPSLLRRDVVGADHIAPELELALEQRARGFRRLLVRCKHLHAALVEGLADLGIGERVAQRGVEPLDDRPRRAGAREQHVP